MTSASSNIGTVDITQMTRVLPIDIQNVGSLIRKRYCSSPTNSRSPRPSQQWKDR